MVGGGVAAEKAGRLAVAPRAWVVGSITLLGSSFQPAVVVVTIITTRSVEEARVVRQRGVTTVFAYSRYVNKRCADKRQKRRFSFARSPPRKANTINSWKGIHTRAKEEWQRQRAGRMLQAMQHGIEQPGHRSQKKDMKNSRRNAAKGI